MNGSDWFRRCAARVVATSIAACGMTGSLAGDGGSPSALSQSTPAPPKRPGDLPKAGEIEPGFAKPEQAGGDACLAQLRALGAIAEPARAPDAPLEGCGIETPVRLLSVAVEGRRTVSFPSKPLLDCVYVLRLSSFIQSLAAPLGAATVSAPIVAVESGPGYECRGRNRDAQAKISAHGKGLALDVSAFVFEGGRRVAVESQTDAAATAYVKALRAAACGWFTTVLGPGSDAAHASHLHLDIKRHGSSENYRICQ